MAVISFALRRGLSERFWWTLGICYGKKKNTQQGIKACAWQVFCTDFLNYKVIKRAAILVRQRISHQVTDHTEMLDVNSVMSHLQRGHRAGRRPELTSPACWGKQTHLGKEAHSQRRTEATSCVFRSSWTEELQIHQHLQPLPATSCRPHTP